MSGMSHRLGDSIPYKVIIWAKAIRAIRTPANISGVVGSRLGMMVLRGRRSSHIMPAIRHRPAIRALMVITTSIVDDGFGVPDGNRQEPAGLCRDLVDTPHQHPYVPAKFPVAFPIWAPGFSYYGCS